MNTNNKLVNQFKYLSPNSVELKENKPDSGGVANALSRIGYKLEEALADLIDNAIDAKSKNILIRIFCDDKTIRSIAIVDDGEGMNEKKLWQSMQFGARIKHTGADLGKYGMGLKTASFSQARILSVITKSSNTVYGSRWSLDKIESGWFCEKLDPVSSKLLFEQKWRHVNMENSGTIILWESIDHLETSHTGVAVTMKKIFKTVPVHLGLVYHRFISNNKLNIVMDSFDLSTNTLGPSLCVEPYDPFKYPTSGKQGYPRSFTIRLPKLPPLVIEAHIWPPKSKSNEYKLGGGNVALRQGFYFYRNNRLIQAGGWNTWRQNQSEPHSSLARVKIDLPSEFDSLFRLKVQKSGIDVPAEFKKALDEIDNGKQASLTSYVQDANDVYRRAQNKTGKSIILIPGSGMPTHIQKIGKKILSQNGSHAIKVRFKWKELSADEIVTINTDDKTIFLNKTNKKLLVLLNNNKTDGAFAKSLIYFVLKEYLLKSKVSNNIKVYIQELNQMLLAALNGEKNDRK